MSIWIINLGIILVALIIAYIVASVGTIDTDEVGLLKFWGKPIMHLSPGPYFAPLGILQVDKEQGTEFQDELPSDPEKIFRDEDTKPVPAGMFPPIRVKFGQPLPKSKEDPALWVLLKGDPYNVAMVAEVVPVVSWRIVDMKKFRAVLGTVHNARKILGDKCVEVFNDEFARITPAKASLGLAVTSQKMEDVLMAEARKGNWGIKITDAYIKPFGFSHHLNKAVVGVKIADQESQALVIRSAGDAQVTINTAEAKATEKVLAAAARQRELLATGLATPKGSKTIIGVDGKPFTFEEIQLLPDANTVANTEAIKALKDVKGTVVLGSGVTPTINVDEKKGWS